MAVQLPIPLPALTGWMLADYRTASARSTPAAGGTATAALPQVPGDELWLLDHAVIACDSTSATTLRLYADSILPDALLDGSSAGNFDVADWPAGLLVPSTRTLLAVWSGASAGAIGTLTAQLRVLRRTQG